MRTAEQWTALYEDGASSLNDPPRHITDIFREIQREAFDYGAVAMKMAAGDMVSRATIATIDIGRLPGRP